MIRWLHRTWYGQVAIVCALVAASSAHAQTVPSSIEPGLIGEELRRSSPLTPELPSPLPRTETPDTTISEGGPSFLLRKIHLEGGTAFSTDELAGIYSQELEKEVQFGDVQRIAQRITEHYRKHGYLLAYAIVPPQRVTDGNVSIRIVEGYIDRVEFRGTEGALQRQLEAYAKHIITQRPLNAEQLERSLLLMEDIPGVRISSVLAPSATHEEAASLVVTVSQDPWEADIHVNNRGTRFLGPLQIGARIAENGHITGTEQIQFRSVVAANFDELRYYEGSYRQPIGSRGFSGGITLTRTETRPGNALEIFDIEGISHAIDLETSYPFLRSRRENWIGSVGASFRNTSSDILDNEIYEDHIRTLYAGSHYDSYDALGGFHALNGAIVRGFSIFGGSDEGDMLSRANADPSATRIEASYSYLHPLPGNFSISLSTAGQYAFAPLVASEEFSIGGTALGSAYDPGEIAGDSGISARAELRYEDGWEDAYITYYQLYLFYDGGKVWNRDILPAESPHDSLTSAGVGSRFSLPYGWAGNLEVAKPLTRPVAAEGSDGEDTRAFFHLLKSF